LVYYKYPPLSTPLEISTSYNIIISNGVNLFIDQAFYSDKIIRMKKDPPLGIKLLSYIYLVNAVLYSMSLVLFYNRILIFGQEANKVISWLIRLALVFIPVYLYIGLRRLKRNAWLLAVYYHIFFFINNGLAFAEYNGYLHPLVNITGFYRYIIYSPSQIFILTLNSIVNLFILGYLLKNRVYFLWYRKV